MGIRSVEPFNSLNDMGCYITKPFMKPVIPLKNCLNSISKRAKFYPLCSVANTISSLESVASYMMIIDYQIFM